MAQLAALILALFNIIMAGHHANLIKKGKRIQHGWWGLGIFAVSAVFAWATSSWLLLLDALFIRKVFFDLFLNLFRGKPLFYVSATTTSIIDRWHNKIFGNRSEVYMLLYSVAIIVITILL